MPPPAAAAPTDSNNAEQQRGADDGDRELDGAGAFNPRGAYDRIICDVPCSGDGTVRKDAFARRKWRPSFGATLHHVQRRIALRSAALLRVGGELSYSTCSLNPIEDEAVVVAILRAARGALELVDSGARAPALPRRPGLETWRVFDYDIPGRRARRRARHRASAATAERNSDGGVCAMSRRCSPSARPRAPTPTPTPRPRARPAAESAAREAAARDEFAASREKADGLTAMCHVGVCHSSVCHVAVVVK